MLDVKGGLAQIAKETKLGNISDKDPTAKPLLAASAQLSRQISELEALYGKKDDAFFKKLSETASTAGELEVVAPRLSKVNKPVNEAVKVIGNATNLLRKNFGKEAQRIKKGGELSASEKKQLAGLIAGQKKFSTQLGGLKAQAQKAGNKRLVSDLTILIDDSNRVSASPNTVIGLGDALLLVDYLEGRWEGYSYYVPPTYRTSWDSSYTLLEVAIDLAFSIYDALTPWSWIYVYDHDFYYSSTYVLSVGWAQSDYATYDSFWSESSYEAYSWESSESYIETSTFESSYEENSIEQDLQVEEEFSADETSSAESADEVLLDEAADETPSEESAVEVSPDQTADETAPDESIDETPADESANENVVDESFDETVDESTDEIAPSESVDDGAVDEVAEEGVAEEPVDELEEMDAGAEEGIEEE